MKQTSPRNDPPALRPVEPDARVGEPLAAELKPNALGAPRLRLLPGAAGLPRFGASFVEAEDLNPAGRGPEPRATFGEDEFAEEEEDEDEFDDDDEEDEDDEFDDDEEDDEFDEDEEEGEEVAGDEEEEVEDEA